MKTTDALMVLLALTAGRIVFADQDVEINTPLLRSTVKLTSGPVVGTGFLIGDDSGQHVALISAAHVFTNMGDRVTIIFRGHRSNDFYRIPTDVVIRTNGVPLYIIHTNADVAGFELPKIKWPAPADFEAIGDNPSLYADDKFFSDFKIHPGDEVRIIGFPRGYEFNAGFPILRSGRIASYPLTPLREVRTILVDFTVFPGNSGGPVFMMERRYMTAGDMGSVTIRKLIGLVSQSVQSTEQIQSETELVLRTQSLGLGMVVPAVFIRDVLDELRSRRK